MQLAAKIKKLYRAEITSQLFKFGLVGVLNTLIDFSSYLILTRVLSWPFLLANAISVLAAMTNSFFFNKYWTFKSSGGKLHVQYVKFALVNLVYFIINNASIWIGVHFFGWHDLWAKVAATSICLAWSFGANKYWTFKAKAVI